MPSTTRSGSRPGAARPATDRKRALRAGSDPAEALAERVKELNCLISISQMVTDRHSSIGDILQQVVHEIPWAWRFPDLAWARLRWGDCTWQTPGFRETPWCRQVPIPARSQAGGFVEIGYREAPAIEGGGPFLPEEERLLRAIAERVGDIIDLKEAERELESYQDRLRSLAAQLAMTEERERRHIAVCLHDRIGQGLAVIKLKLENLRGAARDESQNRVIDQLCEVLGAVMQETRALTFEISPPILHELGLVPALEWLADHVQNHFGLPVTVHGEPGAADLDDDVRTLVFRSVNELLNNVVKHARASGASVGVKIGARVLRVSVADDGVGFDPERADRGRATGGFGLFSVRERLAFVGGSLDIASSPGKGTCVTLTAPLRVRRPTARAGGRSR